MAINTLETATSHVALARTNYIPISLRPNAKSTNAHATTRENKLTVCEERAVRRRRSFARTVVCYN